MFISWSPFWFIRTYIFLYLVAPVINAFLKNITPDQRLYLLMVFGFMSVWVGTTYGDPSLVEGKNLCNFIFLYVVGNTLREYVHIWSRIHWKYYIIVYLFYNVFLVILFTYGLPNRIFSIIFSRIFYSYCSIGLLINALLFFMVVVHFKFQSRTINWIAKSSLSIYIIHSSSLVLYQIIGPFVNKIIQGSHSEIQLIVQLLLLTIGILIGCIFIDNILQPIWKLINILGKKIELIITSRKIILFTSRV